MFTEVDMLTDNEDDEIGNLLKQIREIKTFTKRKRELISEVINTGKKQKYLSFGGYTHRYFIGKVGESFIYHVPKTKKGNLQKFKGKTIRVICIGSGQRFERHYLAGVI